MFFKTMMQSSGTRAGLSVAFLALMSGMALAQDQGLGDTGAVSILPADELVLTDPPIVIGDETVPVDEIIYEGEPDACIGCELPPEEYPTDPGLPDDGVSPMPELPDPVGDGGDVGEELVPEATTQDFPESTCGGCEYQTMSGGEVILNRGSDEVQRTVTGSTFGSGNGDASNFGAGVDVVSDENNICYNADLYIPLLCDWQRPFVGDRMP